MTDARSAGADPGARGGGHAGGGRHAGDGRHARGGRNARGNRPDSRRHPVVAYFRANPQVFALLVICLVLGLGTFIAVLVALVTAGSDQTTGEPSGAILGAHAMLTASHWLVP